MMNQFEDLQQIWQQQNHVVLPAQGADAIAQKAQQLQRTMRVRHLSTMLILGITIAVLVWYCSVYAAHAGKGFALGLFMMIASLLVRVLFEYVSFRHLQRISVAQSMQQYTQQTMLFYQRRLRINFVVTPVVYALYIIGFLLLIPVFYQQFSTGFFSYILFSATVFFVVFAWRLHKQIQHEMKLLTTLKKQLQLMNDAE